MKHWHEVFRKWLMENISVVWILQLLTKFSVYLAGGTMPVDPRLSRIVEHLWATGKYDMGKMNRGGDT